MHVYRTILLFIASCITSIGYATTVTYSTQSIDSTHSKYNFAVVNDTLAAPIQELTFYFDPAVFGQIAIGSTQPISWTMPIVAQSDPAILPNISGYAFFDTVAIEGGIDVGNTLSGFTVDTSVLSPETAGDISFQVINPNTFATLDQGIATSNGTSAVQPPLSQNVPEPSPVLLSLAGLLIIRQSVKKSARSW